MPLNSVENHESPTDYDQKPSLDAFKELAPDSELLAIFVLTRSRDAADQLVRRHGPMVAGIVRRMLSQSSDAEDAFQATFLILLQSATKIQKQSSLSAWLYGVAYRTAYRVRQRSKQRRTLAIHEIVYDPIEIDDPIEKIASESQLELLDRELNRLQPKLKEMLVEHHLLGFTAPQIADRLNLSVSAVEGRLRRGRSQLRARLARRGISFSVALAIAAAYQKHIVAGVNETWTCHLLKTDVFSQSIAANKQPPINTSLQRLIQGELAMKSFLVRGASLTATVACLAVTVCTFPHFYWSGKTMGPNMVLASPEDDVAGTADSPAFEAFSGSGSLVQAPELIDLPSNTGLANVEQVDEPQSSLASHSPVTSLSQMGGGESSVSPPEPSPIKIVPFTKPSGPLPNWMIDGGTLAQEENAARESIRKMIRQTVRPDFNNTPLRSVLEGFAAELKVPIVIDTVALEGAGGTTPEDPVTLTGIPKLSLQRALRLILDPKELRYVVEPEYLLITTKDQGSARALRTYDLAYLLPSNEKVTDLIHLMMTMIPSSWDVDGGEDTLVCFGSMLVACCPEETQLAIEGLLFELSKMNKENFK